jgi:hypothetical protein
MRNRLIILVIHVHPDPKAVLQGEARAGLAVPAAPPAVVVSAVHVSLQQRPCLPIVHYRIYGFRLY